VAGGALCGRIGSLLVPGLPGKADLAEGVGDRVAAVAAERLARDLASEQLLSGNALND
jgi:hypothetical protein